MLDALLTKFRDFVDDIAPSEELLARREAQALQSACCGLMMEVARLDAADAEAKRAAIARALQDLLGIPQQELQPLIANAARQENRLTSYFRPVALLNKHFALERRTQLIEHLWRIANADGKIDAYEDQLVRKLADLLYVPHSDFILAKRRVENGAK